MISYITGKIILSKDKFVIVETGGIGYKVFLSQGTLSKLSLNADTIKLFCVHMLECSIISPQKKAD